MRRRWVAVLMMLLLLLTGCSGGKDGIQAAMDFRAALLQAGGCRFTAELRTDIDDRIYEVTLQCCCRTDGSAELTVLAPETIAGISATVSGSDGRLRFDGVTVDFGLLAGTQFAPVELPALLAAYWQSAYISSAGWIDGELQVSYEDERAEEPIVIDTWFDENMTPLRAELRVDGKVLAVFRLTDAAIDGG